MDQSILKSLLFLFQKPSFINNMGETIHVNDLVLSTGNAYGKYKISRIDNENVWYTDANGILEYLSIPIEQSKKLFYLMKLK